jgi:hypothetical protein
MGYKKVFRFDGFLIVKLIYLLPFFIDFLFSAQNIRKTLRKLNLSEEDYSFLMALVGNFVGFTFLFFAVFSVILISKKK